MKEINFEGKLRVDGLPNKTTKEGKEFWKSYNKKYSSPVKID